MFLGMIGRGSNNLLEQMGINFKEVLDKELEKCKNEDVTIRFALAIKNTKLEVIKKLPVELRMNVISHEIYQNHNNEDNEKEEVADWNVINELLNCNPVYGDYNLLPDIRSIKDFKAAMFNLVASACGLDTWRKEKCKECGEEFYLTKSEVLWFIDKKLKLPKRCKACRNKNKGV